MNWQDEIDKRHKGQSGFFKEIEQPKTKVMKATQLTDKEMRKIKDDWNKIYFGKIYSGGHREMGWENYLLKRVNEKSSLSKIK